MPETETTETMLRVSRVIKAPRDKVYEAFTNPKLLAKWYHPGPMTTTVHQWEPKVGATFHITMHASEGEMKGDHTARGKFTEIVPGKKLSHTWAWESPDPVMGAKGSVVTVELKDAPGGTEVTFIHEMLPGKESVENHSKGWIGCLENLAALF